MKPIVNTGAAFCAGRRFAPCDEHGGAARPAGTGDERAVPGGE